MANEFKVRKGLVVNGSGSVILDIQGSQGQLFSVTDQLSGSLFSVNDISGVPVLEAFSDSTVKIGQYLAEAIIVSGSTARITGSMSLAGFSTGSVLFAGTGGAISQNNSNLFWDNANGRLGIGTNAPGTAIDAVGANFRFRRGGSVDFDVQNTAANSYLRFNAGTGDVAISSLNTFDLGFNVNFNRVITLKATANVLIGTTIDNGARLQVSGSSIFAGNMVITGSGNTSATNALTIVNSDLANLLRLRNDGRIFIGGNANAPYLQASIDGNPSNNGVGAIFYNSINSTSINTGALWFTGNTYVHTSGNPVGLNIDLGFAPTSGTAQFRALQIIGTINQTGGANGITRGLYINPTLTSAPDWRSIEWSASASGSAIWGLYGAGSAPNYLSGSLGIGTTAIGSNALTVVGTTFLSGSVTGSENMLINGRLSVPNIPIITSGITLGQVQGTGPFLYGFLNNGFTSPNSAGLNLGYFNYTTTQTGTQYHFALSGNQINPISGDHTGLFYSRTFAPTTGSATFQSILLRPTISQSSSTGITAGIIINPVLTSATDWRSIQWTNTTGFGLYGSGTAPNFLSGSLGIGTTTPSSSIHINSTTVNDAFLITTPNNNSTLYPFFIGGATLTSDNYLRANSSILEFRRSGGSSTIRTVGASNNLALEGSQHITFSTNGANERGRFTSGGNLLLNDTVDDTFNRLQVTGNARISQALTSSQALISGSGTQRLTVVGSGSAQPLFTVQGSQGELFSIVDSLSGSLFSVNDISGLPIMEVFSDNTTLVGNYLAPMLLTTARTSSAAGINTIYTISTSSYDAVYIDYTIRSGSNARAGNFMAMWSGTSVNFTDNSITEFGSTSGFVFGAHVSGANMVVTGSATTSGWTIKTIIKAI